MHYAPPCATSDTTNYYVLDSQLQRSCMFQMLVSWQFCATWPATPPSSRRTLTGASESRIRRSKSCRMIQRGSVVSDLYLTTLSRTFIKSSSFTDSSPVNSKREKRREKKKKGEACIGPATMLSTICAVVLCFLYLPFPLVSSLASLGGVNHYYLPYLKPGTADGQRESVIRALVNQNARMIRTFSMWL